MPSGAGETSVSPAPAWYRSWPEKVPTGRAYVVDSIPRLLMRDQNYATLPDYQPWPRHDPGWFMLEWDIAMDRSDRERFVANTLDRPDKVRVAPYLLYPDDGTSHRPQQVHRWGGRPISDGQASADSVGFGCIYFPQAVLDDLWSGPPPRRMATQGVLNDVVFSEWCRSRHGMFDVDWTVRPQHLHGD